LYEKIASEAAEERCLNIQLLEHAHGPETAEREMAAGKGSPKRERKRETRKVAEQAAD
jgi:hypothetical protein